LTAEHDIRVLLKPKVAFIAGYLTKILKLPTS